MRNTVCTRFSLQKPGYEATPSGTYLSTIIYHCELSMHKLWPLYCPFLKSQFLRDLSEFLSYFRFVTHCIDGKSAEAEHLVVFVWPLLHLRWFYTYQATKREKERKGERVRERTTERQTDKQRETDRHIRLLGSLRPLLCRVRRFMLFLCQRFSRTSSLFITN